MNLLFGNANNLGSLFGAKFPSSQDWIISLSFESFKFGFDEFGLFFSLVFQVWKLVF